MPRFSLNAIGRDQPGIVAGLASDLARIGANLEDSRMTILGGQFAVMLVIDVASPDGSAIERVIDATAEEFNLFIAVRPLPEQVPERAAGAVVEVAVHGADHPGIVARIASEVAGRGANIVELSSHLHEESGHSTYVMELRLELGDVTRISELTASLERAAAELDVRCTVSATRAL